jgi:hypothetical protein
MKYIVRTVDFDPVRAQNVARLKALIPGLIVVVDTKRDAYNGLFLACNEAEDTGAVILEDDVKLCRDFCAKVERVVADIGADNVINFFEKPKSYFKSGFVRGSGFLWMQCTYFPPHFGGNLKEYYEEFKTLLPQKWRGQAVDCLTSYVLKKLKKKYYRYRPCLVQHLDYKSAIGPRPNNRQSPYFIDDLEEKGISYEDLQPTK